MAIVPLITRLFLFTTLLLLSIPSVSGGSEQPVDDTSQQEQPLSIGAAFNGESLHYRLSFWWFKYAADSHIALSRDGDNFLITMSAETAGFIGWVTKHRKDRYRVYVEEVEGGRRFKLKRLEKEVTIGEKVRKSVITMDYEKRIMTTRRWGRGKSEQRSEEPIPEDTYYDDPLTAFYNFRFGAYGPIEEGREYHITTFPKNGVSTMYLRLATGEEKVRRRTKIDATEYLADITIEREMFGSQSGNIEVLFSKELVPLEGVVKDIILFGDVRGALVERGRSRKVGQLQRTD
ncbi:MAG: hypothetical protein ACE5D4_03695 [Thermodesulfobacteriota bacterium]